ncbi:MAG TPA: twin-arginine translocase TatA/TatE family subunit [Thermoanaerobaculia bacterium]|nr:twin-arginine translocase TatA/TatE family subunit [Thermoanaerobaculia bacterium]
MFGPLGVPELLFILVLALLIFGPKRLPEVGRTLGRGMSEFRKASNELKRTVNAELALEEEPTPPALRPYRVEPPAPAPVEEPQTETPPETSQPLGPH